MSYQLNFVADFGASAAGLSMNGKVLDVAGAQVGVLVTTGIVEIVPGAYSVALTLPDNHVGSFVLYDANDAATRAVFAINPQEGEYLNARVDSRLAAGAYVVPPDASSIWGHGERTLTTPFPASPTPVEIRQELDANSSRLALLNAPVGGLATPADVATALATTLAAIGALHNLSASDVDGRLAAYDAATGGELAAATQALQAAIGALHNLSVADVQATTAAVLVAQEVPTASDILDGPISEPVGVFDWQSATLRDIVGWLGALHRNTMQQGAMGQVLRNGTDTMDIATATTIDDGATLTRGAWV